MRLMLSTTGQQRLLILADPVPGGGEEQPTVTRSIPLESIR
jgi:hypothetical protein